MGTHNKCADWFTSPQPSPRTPASLIHTHIHQRNPAGLLVPMISRDSTIPLVSLYVHRDSSTIPLGSLCIHRDAPSHKTSMPSRISATGLPALRLRSSLPLSWQRYSEITTLTSFEGQIILVDCRCRCVNLCVHWNVNVVHFLSPLLGVRRLFAHSRLVSNVSRA